MTTTPESENPMPLDVLVNQISSPIDGVLDDNFGGEESLSVTHDGLLTIGFEGMEDRDPAVYESDGTALYTDVEFKFIQKERLVSYLSDFLDPDTIETMIEDLFHE